MHARVRIQQKAAQIDLSTGGCFYNGSTARALYGGFEPHAGSIVTGTAQQASALQRQHCSGQQQQQDMTCHAMHLLGPSLLTPSTSLVVDTAGSSKQQFLHHAVCDDLHLAVLTPATLQLMEITAIQSSMQILAVQAI